MGASKRLAELCIQGVYEKYRKEEMSFSIVRLEMYLSLLDQLFQNLNNKLQKEDQATNA